MNNEQAESVQKFVTTSNEYSSFQMQSEQTHNKVNDITEMTKTLNDKIKQVVSDDIKLLESAPNNQILSEDTRHSLETNLNYAYSDFAESVKKMTNESDDFDILKDFDEADTYNAPMRFTS